MNSLPNLSTEDEIVTHETVGKSDSNGALEAVLAWKPVFPNTLVVNTGRAILCDDGHGLLATTPSSLVMGEIDYARGAIKLAGCSPDYIILASYRYDSLAAPYIRYDIL